MQAECNCNCGYSCNRECGLPILECMEQHYVKDCEHVWNGEINYFKDGATVTCSKCGMSAMNHDMTVGP